MAIISAFDNSAVGRLKKTWEVRKEYPRLDVGFINTHMQLSFSLLATARLKPLVTSEG